MKEYHKIQTLFKRDEKTKQIIEGDWTLPEFEFLKDNQWVFTEKVDGTNIRVHWDGKDITFGGRTENAQIPSFLLNKLHELFYTTEKKQLFKETFGDADVCFYGEGYGKKIQGDMGANYNSEGNDFVLFDISIGDWWLERENTEALAEKFGVKVVPIIGEGTLVEAIELTRQGIKSQWGDFLSEGIVARPKAELKTRKGERLIAKIKHRDFFKGIN